MVSRVAAPRASSARFRVEHVARTGSTNADVLARAAAGEPAGLVLVAAHQTAGRGRLERRWQAPPGTNLLVSVLFRPALPPAEWHRCLGAVAVAAVDACIARGVAAGIKWPNDLVVGDDKLGGILAETDGRGAVVVGLGCNVAWPRAGEFPGATSLAALGVAVDPGVLLSEILDVLERVDEHHPELHDRYLARSATLGREVRVILPDGAAVEGVVCGIDPSGELVVENTAGRRSFTVADVVHLR
jgi:BirA family transcriptional regulator, biotin operon repressor / biotin---[acetyl-CoA-carboxylase] ligase